MKDFLILIITLCLLNSILSLKAFLKSGIWKTEIRIHYNSFSAEDIFFFDNSFQLFFIKKELYDQFKIILMPVASMNFTKDGDKEFFTCKNGKKECLANTLHACAIYLWDLEKTYEYIICHFQNIRNFDYDNYKTINFCSAKLKFKKDELLQCVESGIGKKYILNLIKRKNALNIVVDHSPFAVIDNRYNKLDDKKLIDDMTSFTCNLQQDLPICLVYKGFLL